MKNLNKLQSVLVKQSELKKLIEEINNPDFLNNFSEEELTTFSKEFKKLDLPYLSLTISKVLKEKELERRPELLLPHFYPEINEASFLSLEEKMNLDKNLFMNRGSRVFFTLKDYIPWHLHDQTYQFLIDHKILERQVRFHCTCNSQNPFTDYFNANLKEQFEKDLFASNDSHEAIGLIEELCYSSDGLYCDDCGEENYFGDISSYLLATMPFNTAYCRIKEPAQI